MGTDRGFTVVFVPVLTAFGGVPDRAGRGRFIEGAPELLLEEAGCALVPRLARCS